MVLPTAARLMDPSLNSCSYWLADYELLRKAKKEHNGNGLRGIGLTCMLKVCSKAVVSLSQFNIDLSLFFLFSSCPLR